MQVFILTGAGISAESGLGTFRDGGGLWSRFDLREVATPEGFARDPAKVDAFYSMRRTHHRAAQPNAAHRALVKLELGFLTRGDRFFLCTQNVDNLHEKAGSQRVHHMHGEVFVSRCIACDKSFPDDAPLDRSRACPLCDHVGQLRPQVVWFGEDSYRSRSLRGSIGLGGSVRRDRHLRHGLAGGGVRRESTAGRRSDAGVQFGTVIHEFRRAAFGPGERDRPRLGRGDHARLTYQG